MAGSQTSLESEGQQDADWYIKKDSTGEPVRWLRRQRRWIPSLKV